MASFRRSTLAANAEADAVGALLSGGYLDIYDGQQPASCDDPVIRQHRIARLRFGSPAFTAAANGVATSYPLQPDTNAALTGTPTWFRAVTRLQQPVFDGSVGKAAADCILNVDKIFIHSHVSVSSVVYRAIKG